MHAYFSKFFGGKKKTKLNGNYLGNSLDEKSWLALTKRIFCWKIFQRTERKSQQFCFTGLLLDSTLVQSDKIKGFWKCDELSLKVDFSRDCCKNLSSTSALRFSLTWKIITLKCLWLIPTSVIQQSVKNNTNKNNQQMNQTQLVLHSNNLVNVIKHEFYHTDKVQLLKFNSFRISYIFAFILCADTLSLVSSVYPINRLIVLKDYENMKPVYADCYKPSWNKHFTSRRLWKFLCRTTNARAAKEF